MEVKSNEHGSTRVGFIDKIMPYIVSGALIIMATIVFKMVGVWPVSQSNREMVDSMILEYPFLDDSVYRTLRFESGYFSENDLDMILHYWSIRLQSQYKREVDE